MKKNKLRKFQFNKEKVSDLNQLKFLKGGTSATGVTSWGILCKLPSGACTFDSECCPQPLN